MKNSKVFLGLIGLGMSAAAILPQQSFAMGSSRYTGKILPCADQNAASCRILELSGTIAPDLALEVNVGYEATNPKCSYKDPFNHATHMTSTVEQHHATVSPNGHYELKAVLNKNPSDTLNCAFKMTSAWIQVTQLGEVPAGELQPTADLWMYETYEWYKAPLYVEDIRVLAVSPQRDPERSPSFLSTDYSVDGSTFKEFEPVKLSLGIKGFGTGNSHVVHRMDVRHGN